MSLGVCLGDDLVANDVDHRARGEPHRVREEWCGQLDCPGAEECQGNLDESGTDARDRRVEQASEPSVQGCYGDSQPFGDILDSDGYHQRYRVAEVTRTESDAYCEPFRHIVEGDRDDKQDYGGDPPVLKG